MNRRGQVDILTMAIVIFVIAFLSVLTYVILSNIGTSMSTISNSSVSDLSKTNYTTYSNNLASGLDQGIVIALGLIFVITLVFAARINTNPGFFFVFLFLLIFILASTSFLPQLFDQGTNNLQFSAARSALPMTTYIASNLFQIAVAMAVLLGLVLFSKINRGGSQ